MTPIIYNKKEAAINKLASPSLPIEYLKSSPNWHSDELKVYEAKYKGQPFGKMSNKELEITVDGIAMRISVIAGCQLPTDDRHFNLMEFEISNLLTTDKAFSTLTCEEVMAAFRMNATGQLGEKVKHWQNILNLDYLAEVLNNWVDLRDRVEKKIEEEELKLMISLPGPKIPDDEIIETAKSVLKSTNGNYLMISYKVYDILLNQGKINLTEEEKNQIRRNVKEVVNEMFRKDKNLFQDTSRQKQEMMISKQIAVARYFEQNEKMATPPVAQDPLQSAQQD